ncbi:MAG: hypothetical protein M3P70_18195 [Actinomycetota bacterium]|nr:hypothetical protein [Actinomycetota bacterium]
MKIRTYARIAAIFLLAVAVFGFWAREWRVVSIFYHAGVGLLFLYVGFLLKDTAIVRQMVGGLGVLLLAVKAITVLTPLTWGGHALHGPIEITCLVLGVSSILAARYLPDDRPGRSEP